MRCKKSDWLVMGVGTLIIICFCAISISRIYTVWELVDEYGYLANAAYLSGSDWSCMTNYYYGYGYSLWLIPLFWIFESGISIIRGAVAINGLFMVLLFWVQCILMSKIYRNLNSKIIALISFVLCFYPYLIVSEWKIICECLLTLMVWVCGLVLYQALDTGKRYWYALLGVTTAYIFFVHTRAFVFSAVLIMAMVLMFLQKKINRHNMAVFFVVFVICVVLGTLLKNHIIEAMYTNTPGGNLTETVGNTLTVSYIIEKITGFFTGLSMIDFDSFACKVFYLFVGTVGMFPLGLYAIGKRTVIRYKKERKLTTESVIMVLYGVAAIGMVLALVVNPMGETEGTAHYFYARYYEYLIAPVVFAGVAYCIEEKLHIPEVLGLIVIVLFFGWFATDTARFLDTQELYLDTNRMPALSYILQHINWFPKIIERGVIIAICCVLCIFLINRVKKIRWCMLAILLIVFMLSNLWNVLFMVRMNYNNLTEYQIAEFVHGNYEADEIYFLNDDTNAVLAYTKIQSLMGNIKIKVMNPSDINQIQQGDLFVTLQFNPYVEEFAGRQEQVLKLGCYEVYTIR